MSSTTPPPRDHPSPPRTHRRDSSTLRQSVLIRNALRESQEMEARESSESQDEEIFIPRDADMEDEGYDEEIQSTMKEREREWFDSLLDGMGE